MQAINKNQIKGLATMFFKELIRCHAMCATTFWINPCFVFYLDLVEILTVGLNPYFQITPQIISLSDIIDDFPSMKLVTVHFIM